MNLKKIFDSNPYENEAKVYVYLDKSYTDYDVENIVSELSNLRERQFEIYTNVEHNGSGELSFCIWVEGTDKDLEVILDELLAPYEVVESYEYTIL